MSLIVLIPMFIPIAAGAVHLYPWPMPRRSLAMPSFSIASGDMVLGPSIARAAVYLVVWMS